MEWYSKYLQVYEKPFAEAPQSINKCWGRIFN